MVSIPPVVGLTHSNASHLELSSFHRANASLISPPGVGNLKCPLAYKCPLYRINVNAHAHPLPEQFGSKAPGKLSQAEPFHSAAPLIAIESLPFTTHLDPVPTNSRSHTVSPKTTLALPIEPGIPAPNGAQYCAAAPGAMSTGSRAISNLFNFKAGAVSPRDVALRHCRKLVRTGPGPSAAGRSTGALLLLMSAVPPAPFPMHRVHGAIGCR